MPPYLVRFVTTVAVCSALLAIAGCKAKVGGNCKPTQGACASETESLTCGPGQTYVTMACKGPGGCVFDKETRKASCDRSIADEGDFCLVSPTENFACSPDKTKVLTCDAGRFATHQSCRGPKACSVEHGEVSCDTSVQVKGDPCLKPGTTVCSADAKVMLRCKETTFEVYRYCRGATGCVGQKEGPHCDERLAEVGDPCSITAMLVCSTNGKNELICRGGKFEHERECRKIGCHLTAGSGIDCN